MLYTSSFFFIYLYIMYMLKATHPIPGWPHATPTALPALAPFSNESRILDASVVLF